MEKNETVGDKEGKVVSGKDVFGGRNPLDMTLREHLKIAFESESMFYEIALGLGEDGKGSGQALMLLATNPAASSLVSTMVDIVNQQMKTEVPLPGIEVGSRVKVIAFTDKKTGEVCVLGEGVYEGSFESPEYFGFPKGMLNHRIKLDTGEEVWGFEVWWGPVEEINKKLEGQKVRTITVQEFLSGRES